MSKVQAHPYSSVKGERPRRRSRGRRREHHESKPVTVRSAPPSRRTKSVDWSAPLGLGPNIRIQAKRGFRAVVQEIRPGMFIVAETPEQQVTEFGAAILAPLLIKTATKALQNPQATAQAAKGVLNAGKGLVKRLPTRAKEPKALEAPPASPLHGGHVEPVDDGEYFDPEFEEDYFVAGLIPAPRPSFMGRWVDRAILSGLYRRGI